MAIYEHYEFAPEPLGEGSYGVVELVTNRVTGQQRACKVIGIESDEDRSLVDNEIQLLKRLDHPNILRLSEYFLDGRNIYLVSELCRGGPLVEGFLQRVQRNISGEVVAAECMRQILGAAMYCHARGVVHRDLKPDNVLYVSPNQDSLVKVIDFGLAGFLDRFRKHDGNMRRAGTLVFMAPEMIASRTYNEKVDVWACGCMLFLLATGEHPFWTKNQQTEDIKARILHGQFIENPNWAMVPPAVRDLIQRLLTLDPGQRCSAAEALQHPWLRQGGGAAAGEVDISKSIFEGLGKFQASSKLKKAILKLLAKEVDEGRIQGLREKFRALNVQQDGQLTRDDLLRGMREHLHVECLTRADMSVLLPHWTNDRLTASEFVAALLSRQGITRAELLSAFRRFDVRGEGRISMESLAHVLKCAGPTSCLDAFREADLGQDGYIDFESIW